ncbi:hypothetical protein CHU32_08365 [Superficieibacter electus]|uniref:Uncharacterized protein n=1 Tax=Superficieibacter electus TaxID=2022662 RepID=A0A2P5GS02_9ENTR|nr:DUF2625 family protein [Superficieibacter electus]POP46044.1 hypothetical protein CHU33_06820 [Superficieibacter electus]POP49351.1 hypothetical protein CHU32_08365 [Superficieibacter electus]
MSRKRKAPDSLKWESLEVGYSHFLQWALTGDLDLFYNNVRWEGWQTEVKALSGELACHFYPFLWTSSETPRSRRIVPVTEIWDQQQDVIRQLLA